MTTKLLSISIDIDTSKDISHIVGFNGLVVNFPCRLN